MPYLYEGYAAGFVYQPDEAWLTIPGSTYRSHDVVHATREEAEAWAEERPGRELVVRYVRRTYHGGVTVTGEAFRVIEAPRMCNQCREVRSGCTQIAEPGAQPGFPDGEWMCGSCL